MEDKKNQLVAKSNAMIDAFYSLSLMEHRLIAYSISQIERNDIPRTGSLPVHIRLSDFKKFFKVEHESVARIRKAIDRLYDRSIHIHDPETNTKIDTRWLGEKRENAKKDKITLVFYERVVPHLTGLKGNYTLYLLNVTADFKSQYTFQVYEILAKSRNLKEEIVVIPLEYLRIKLGLEGKYKLFKDFKKRVLDPVFKDLNDSTLMSVDYELIKKGRSYVSLQVIFQETPEATPQEYFNKTARKTSKRGSKAPKDAKVTQNAIKQHARPGETLEQVIKRLRDTVSFAV